MFSYINQVMIYITCKILSSFYTFVTYFTKMKKYKICANIKFAKEGERVDLVVGEPESNMLRIACN